MQTLQVLLVAFLFPYTPIMPRGKQLSENQRAQILALLEAKVSLNKIATIINKSRRVVQNFAKKPEEYCSTSRKGRKPRMTAAQTRLLLRTVRNTGATAQNLVLSLALPVGKKRVQAILRSDTSVQWRRPMKGPWLSPAHVQARLNWACGHVGTPQSYWDKFVWSDEK